MSNNDKTGKEQSEETLFHLLFLTIPLQQSKTLPVNWFQTIYYALTVIMSGIAGLVVATVIMLYTAIQSIIQAVRPDTVEKGSEQKDR